MNKIKVLLYCKKYPKFSYGKQIYRNKDTWDLVFDLHDIEDKDNWEQLNGKIVLCADLDSNELFTTDSYLSREEQNKRILHDSRYSFMKEIEAFQCRNKVMNFLEALYLSNVEMFTYPGNCFGKFRKWKHYKNCLIIPVEPVEIYKLFFNHCKCLIRFYFDSSEKLKFDENVEQLTFEEIDDLLKENKEK